MPAEVGANPAASAVSEIYANILADLGGMSAIHGTMDDILHALDYSLWAQRPQSARDKFEAPWGATFTVASCVTVANSKTVTTASSITSVVKGQYVTGTGVPAGTFINSVGTGSFTLSNPATAAGTVTLTFYPPCLGETFNRNDVSSVTTAIATGTLYLSAVSLPINATISNLVFMPGTTGDAGPTNQWMALFDNQRRMLAISADGLTTAIVASTPAVYPVATVAAGAATSFTTTYSGQYYLGFMIATANSPLQTVKATFTGTTTLPPILCGTSNTGLTTPVTFPTTATAITATANRAYLYCY